MDFSIKIRTYLRELLEKVFTINSLNFDLAAVLNKLLKMLQQPYSSFPAFSLLSPLSLHSRRRAIPFLAAVSCASTSEHCLSISGGRRSPQPNGSTQRRHPAVHQPRRVTLAAIACHHLDRDDAMQRHDTPSSLMPARARSPPSRPSRPTSPQCTWMPRRARPSCPRPCTSSAPTPSARVAPTSSTPLSSSR
jgi:hypothetical protein